MKNWEIYPTSNLIAERDLLKFDRLAKVGKSRNQKIIAKALRISINLINNDKFEVEKIAKKVTLVLLKSTYFLICFTQTKITLFIFVNNWVIRENESFLLVEPCSRVEPCPRVTCCVEIKLQQFFFVKYISICKIDCLMTRLISAIIYDLWQQLLGKTYGLRY